MSSLTQDYKRTALHSPESVLTGLDARLHTAAGAVAGVGREFALLEEAARIEAEETAWKDLSEEALRGRLDELRQLFRRRRKGYEALVPRALAAVREAAARRVGLRAFRVQLAGALALYQGAIIEMATGEGKTLTAALAAVLHGWSGLPCHVVTVNDYLAARDAEWMGPLFATCRVSVGSVTGEMDGTARRKGYEAEVTYTTSKEIVADFLRDRLWMGDLQKPERRQVASLLGAGKQLKAAS